MKSRLPPRISNWLTRWQVLVGLEPGRHEPGFLGSVPYVLILRYFIAGAVIVRFWLHKPEYNDIEWWSRLLVFILILLATMAATYVTFFKPKLRRSQVLQTIFIMADVGFISAAYWLTNNPESDFFLFYYLPIFAAVEYLEWKGTSAVCCGVGVAMLIVVFSMHPSPQPRWTHSGLVWRVLVPRGFFLLVVVLSSAFVFKILSRRQAELRLLLDSLHSSSAAMPDVQALDEALESILSELTEKLNFEFAAISLVDEYRDCIETVRGRNISPGWVTRAKHDLNVPDIQTHIVNTGETKIIAGWDELLDEEIYDRFEHGRLARVWAPILSADQKVVGTIEAGCDKDRKEEVFTNSAIERVKQLGREKGDEIARKRPHVLLQGIARNAIQLIGADSATLHVYSHKIPESLEGKPDEWGEPILATGAGEATPEFVKSYKPGPGGRGRKATRTGKPEWVDDPIQFKADYPKLYGLGLRALAVIPLHLGPDTQGILAIHFWHSGKRFTPRDLNLATMFAREMEVVIQNYLLLRRATEAGSRAWALSGLQSLMQSLTSPFHLPDVLKKVAKNVLLTLDADNVTVYQYYADDNTFDVPPVTDGQFLAPGLMKAKIKPDDVLFRFIQYGSSQFMIAAHEQTVLTMPSESGKPRFIDREKVKSCASLVLRSGEAGEVVGLIFVNFRKVHDFSAEEKRAMDALATSAALAIRTARLHKADVARQLQAMHAVHAAIAEKGPDLKQVLERLLQQTLALTGARYGVCMRCVEPSQVLEAIARWPPSEDRPVPPQPIVEGIVGLAAKSKKSILVEDVEDGSKVIFVETVGEILPAKVYKKVNPDTRCELAVPLLDEGQLLGVLNIEHPDPCGLNEDHKALLETLAVPAIIAFHTVDLYKRLGRRIKHLSALNLIAARVQEKPFELDTILRLFLTGVTSGGGLGFSRAMLFLAGDGGRVLTGKFTIGAITRQEAEEVWARLPDTASDSTEDLNSLLQQAEHLGDEIREGKIAESSPLNLAIQQVSLPVDITAGAAGECLLKGRTIRVDYKQPDLFREVLGRLTEPNDLPHAFAAVPLVGKHTRRIGAMIVDNRFLEQERVIDEEQLAGLEAYAGLLSLTIENALLEQQQVESWKELTAGIAHSVGTRIAAIAGKVTRLREASQLGDTTTEARGLLSALTDGISKAQEVLLGFRTFATPKPLQTEHLDLRDVITDMLRDFQGMYSVGVTLPNDPLPVFVDSLQLSNALMEVIKNSYEATLGTTPQATITLTASVEFTVGTGRRHVRLDIKDNGPGVPDHVKPFIFQPFVSTKNGSGLGLAIARSVIERHGGDIAIVDNCDGGAWFIIRIPTLGMGAVVKRGAVNG